MKFSHLTSRAEIRDLIAWHNANSGFAVLDTETTDKDARKAGLIDVQLSGRAEDEAVMFGAEFAPLLLELTCPLVLQNYKYDFKVLYRHGVDLRSKRVWDVMLLHHLANENADHDLGSIIAEAGGEAHKSDFWEKYDNYADAPLAERMEYGCKDVVETGRAYLRTRADLAAQGIPESLSVHVHRLAAALLDTEIAGLKVDLDYCIQMGSELKSDIVRTEAELRTLGGYHCEIIELSEWAKEIEKTWTPKGKKWQTIEKPEFNFASSAQVSRLLYDQLKLPPQFNPKTKKRTADDKALEKLGDAHPLLPEIRKLRKFQKMYGSFIEGVLDKVLDGRIYPSFNVNGTVTGRISHSEPNMGQMPSKGEWAKIRGIFVPDPGHKIITCDYGMLEVVIAAHFSQDANLLKIIHEGASKHDITASGLGIDRNKAKTLNFAMQYQCSAKKVAEILGCSKADAEHAWNKYWETYAGEKRVIDECKLKVDRGEPIINPFGRRRRFPTEFQTFWEKEAAYRQAYSSLIQGTGGDLTSAAFYRVSEDMRGLNFGRGLFTIHDEILAQARTAQVPDAQAIIQSHMIQVGQDINLSVPLTVDCSEGLDRWQK